MITLRADSIFPQFVCTQVASICNLESCVSILIIVTRSETNTSVQFHFVNYIEQFVNHPSLCTRHTLIHNTEHNVSLWIYEQFTIFLNCWILLRADIVFIIPPYARDIHWYTTLNTMSVYEYMSSSQYFLIVGSCCVLTLCLSSLPMHETYTGTQHWTQCQSMNIWAVPNISKLFDPVACWHCVYHPSLCTRHTLVHNTEHNVSLWIYDQFIIFLNCLIPLCADIVFIIPPCARDIHRYTTQITMSACEYMISS